MKYQTTFLYVCTKNLTTYKERTEVVRTLLEAGPRLVATYTWSQLHLQKHNEIAQQPVSEYNFSRLTALRANENLAD
jgi:hypothetical protein